MVESGFQRFDLIVRNVSEELKGYSSVGVNQISSLFIPFIHPNSPHNSFRFSLS